MWKREGMWNPNVGLLVIRVGLGLAFLVHGLPKLTGGPEMWTQLGGAMGVLGIHFAPSFWGLLAAVSETVGGLCLLMGVLFRPALLGLLATMAVAALVHLQAGEGFAGAAHALEAGVVFAGLLWTGPGRFRVPSPWLPSVGPSRRHEVA